MPSHRSTEDDKPGAEKPPKGAKSAEEAPEADDAKADEDAEPKDTEAPETDDDAEDAETEDVAEAEVSGAQADDTAADNEAPEVVGRPSGPLEAPPRTNRYQLLFLAAAFVTAILVLILIIQSRAWDPYLCATDDDCRGVKQCLEGRCVSPEVWERQHGTVEPQSPPPEEASP